MLARTLVVWFVLLAVPFQGFAAAAMTCARGMSAAPAAHGAPSQAASHHGDEAKPPCHQQAAAQQVPDDGEPHQETCGNCAACSVGAAIAPAALSASPDCCPCSCCPGAAQARVAAIDPDLPERPPRPLLA